MVIYVVQYSINIIKIQNVIKFHSLYKRKLNNIVTSSLNIDSKVAEMFIYFRAFSA